MFVYPILTSANVWKLVTWISTAVCTCKYKLVVLNHMYERIQQKTTIKHDDLGERLRHPFICVVVVRVVRATNKYSEHIKS